MLLLFLVYLLDLFWILQIYYFGYSSVSSLDFGEEMKNIHCLSQKSVGIIIIPITKMKKWRVMQCALVTQEVAEPRFEPRSFRSQSLAV